MDSNTIEHLTNDKRNKVSWLRFFIPIGIFTCIFSNHLVSAQESLHSAQNERNSNVFLAQTTAAEFLQRARDQNRNADYQGALESINRSLSLNDQDWEAYQTRALIYSSLGRFSESVEDYGRSIQLIPAQSTNKFRLIYSRGLVYLNLGRIDEAANDFSTAINLAPRNSDSKFLAEIYYRRGFVRSENNDASGAIEDFSRVVALDSNHLGGYAQRGATYAGYYGDYVRAIPDLMRASGMNPQDNAEFLWNRGLAKNILGDLSGAFDDYSNARAKDIDYLRAYLGMASIYFQLGNYQDGLGFFEKPIARLSLEGSEANPRLTNIGLFDQAASTLAEFGKVSEALDVLNNGISSFPDSAILYFNRGSISSTIVSSDAQSQALSDFAAALSRENDFAVAYLQRGNIYFSVERDDAALADYSRAIDISKNFTDAYIARGAALVRRNREADGRKDLQMAVNLSNEVIRVNPEFAPAYVQRAFAKSWLGDQNGYYQDYSTALDLWVRQGNRSLVMAALEGYGYQENFSGGYADLFISVINDVLSEQDKLLNDNTYFKPHNFSGDQGQFITITLSSLDFDPYLLLYSPSGDLITYNDDISVSNTNAQIKIILPESGAYTIHANTYEPGEVGNYLLLVR